MSRLTAAQIVARGDYLEPDFDPSTLTVPQLLGVFGFHNVVYPSPYTKPKLVQLFNEEIKAKSKKLKKDRLKRENSQASDDGIKDGITGRPLNEGKVPLRRSSRRPSRAPSEEQPQEPEPAPPKRRRSTAEPTIGGPSKRRTTKPVQPTVNEESEPEEEVMVRKVGRNKKSTTDAGSRARRVSQAFPEDSGWEDHNIFQSGAESSSPARPSPVRPRTRRTSVAPHPLKSRKSMSAPPQYLSSPPSSPSKDKGKGRAPGVKPPESSFEPQLPPGLQRETRASMERGQKSKLVPEASASRRVMSPTDHLKQQEETEEDEQIQALQEAIAENTEAEAIMESEGEAEEDQVTAVSRCISQGGDTTRRASRSGSASAPIFLRIVLALFALLGSGAVLQYKQQSAQIGFCDTGKATNAHLESLRAHWAAVESCNNENRTTLYVTPEANDTASVRSPIPTHSPERGVHHDSAAESSVVLAEACPPLPLSPLPYPDTCTPCPLHATCTPSTMTCDTGYIVRPHPLLYFLPVPGTSASLSKSPTTFTRPGHSLSPSTDVPHLVYSALSLVLDGMPGMGPIALSPHCEEDPRRKRHIGVLGKAVEAMLAAERGRRLCEGTGVGLPEGDEATEAKRWGVQLEKLKEDLRRKTAPNLLGTLDDTFNEAIQQLIQWGGVFMGEDAEGRRYLAHRTPVMSWDCALRVQARESWAEWNKSIITGALLIVSVFAFRRRQAQKHIEDERVASLVQIALDLLRNQEMAHHTDPVTAPQPYLSSLQLRDLILQDEHSVRARRRLWERVERVVEGNANVRTNLEEVAGGDELRVWRWVGSAGKTLSPA
ncbi:hypothetical protein SCP_0406090 [Sparassis crispa]|uniref:Man1/Src1 C-terminal domain-containing protein n=1 Tax=Sparassis crispa TaxID=139825 RepID=A0A401GJ68_9APHY|nr:hypothetical protein SCP_0406090 [Sparassis crispa]GBE82226.1 hypothetical protein SCP_0406090 [Sparassis crispa]